MLLNCLARQTHTGSRRLVCQQSMIFFSSHTTKQPLTHFRHTHTHTLCLYPSSQVGVYTRQAKYPEAESLPFDYLKQASNELVEA